MWRARTLDGNTLYFGDAAQILDRNDYPSLLGDRAPLTREEDKYGNIVDYYWRTNGVTPSNGADDVVTLNQMHVLQLHLERVSFRWPITIRQWRRLKLRWWITW